MMCGFGDMLLARTVWEYMVSGWREDSVRFVSVDGDDVVVIHLDSPYLKLDRPSFCGRAHM